MCADSSSGAGLRARGPQLLAEARALDELPDARPRDELAVLDEHVAAQQHDLRRTR